MFYLTTFVSALFFVQIAPTTHTARPTAAIRESRESQFPRVFYEPCRNQPVGKFMKDRYFCDKFFYCGPNELAISVDCPHGMIFNDEKEICDFPSNYLCLPERMEEVTETAVTEVVLKPSVTPPTNHVIKDNNLCPKNDASQLVYLSNPDDCHRYFICYHGYPIPQECIRELHWNSKMRRCDFPENAGCLVRTSTTTTAMTPPMSSYTPVNVAGSISCPFRGEQIFPHPEQCNYFIYCVNGYATVQQCPFFHHYDVLSKSCMWQTMTKCVVSKKKTNL